MELILERLFLYSLIWSVGGMLDDEDRVKFDVWLRERDERNVLPEHQDGLTIYEYYINPSSGAWEIWKPPSWEYPQTDSLDFSNLLVPTMDSTRSQYIIHHLHKQKKPIIMIGAEGTAKTSTALMYFS
jgi:dynein heavy chain